MKLKAASRVDATGLKVTGLEGATDIVYTGDALKGVSKSGEDSILGTYFSSDEDSLPLPNNGGSPVVDDKGEVVKFTYGDSDGYIMYMGKNSWKPYISEVKAIKAGSKMAAVESLMGEGCGYYIDKNYATDNGYLMIGYTRTDKESEAITDIIGLGGSEAGSDDLRTANITGYEKVSDESIAGYTLYVSRDSSVGNPICDLDSFGEASGITVTSKMLANIRLSRTDAKAKQFIVGSDAYKSFIEDEEEYIIEGVQTSDGTDIGISLASKETGLKEKNNKKNELLSPYFKTSSSNEKVVDEGEEAVESDDEADAESVGSVDGAQFDTVTDETYDDAPMTSDGTTEDVEDTEGTEGTVLSVLGGTGATVFFVIVFGIAIVIPIVAIFINKRLKKVKKEE